MNADMHGESDRGSWTALLDEATKEEVENLEIFDNLAERIRAVRAPGTGGAKLAAADRAVAAVTVLAGRTSATPLLDQVAPVLSDVIQELMPVPGRKQLLAAYWTLSYLNAARCAAAAVPDAATDAERDWLPVLASMGDEFSELERHTLALAACACGHVAIVTSIVDARALPAFTPSETFGFNVQGFALYLAAAIEQRASYEDIEMAWLDFVHCFPIKLDTETLDWPALLWAARAVYSTIGGIPVAEVGDELHTLVTGA